MKFGEENEREDGFRGGQNFALRQRVPRRAVDEDFWAQGPDSGANNFGLENGLENGFRLRLRLKPFLKPFSKPNFFAPESGPSFTKALRLRQDFR